MLLIAILKIKEARQGNDNYYLTLHIGLWPVKGIYIPLTLHIIPCP